MRERFFEMVDAIRQYEEAELAELNKEEVVATA